MEKFVSLSTGVRIQYVEQDKADGVPVIRNSSPRISRRS
jgi:hypothetical protein